eukprot:3907041-Pyramimonas_sp.AAC.1
MGARDLLAASWRSRVMRHHGHPRPRGLVRGPAGAFGAIVIHLVWSAQSPATVTCRTEVHDSAQIDMNAVASDLHR